MSFPVFLCCIWLNPEKLDALIFFLHFTAFPHIILTTFMGFFLLFFYILQTGLQPEEGFSFCCHLISLVAAVREIMFAVHMNCEKHWGESFPLTESKTNLWNIFQIKKYQWRACPQEAGRGWYCGPFVFSAVLWVAKYWLCAAGNLLCNFKY